MPVVLYPRVVKRLGRFAALMAAAVLAVPAVASAASCPAQATTTPFAQWGDSGSYFPVAGGNFEAPLRASGWTVTGAERTVGNEPFYVGSHSDSYSLTMGGGGVAISPAFCVDDSMPYFRFFAHALGRSGNLQVRLVFQTTGGLADVPFSHAVDLASASMVNWAPTAQLNLGDGSVLGNGETGVGRLVFDVAGASSWQLDDIYVDPFRMG
jgi:hypothetical protein